MIEEIRELIILYMPTILMVITGISNFFVVINKIKSIDYKTPLTEAKDSLIQIKQEINTCKTECVKSTLDYTAAMKSNEELKIEYEKFQQAMEQKLDKLTDALVEVTNKYSEVKAEINKRGE